MYPNPSAGQATLSLKAQARQTATVYVRDEQGRLVALLSVPVAAAKVTDFRLPLTLAGGTYHLHTKLDGKPVKFTLKVVR